MILFIVMMLMMNIEGMIMNIVGMMILIWETYGEIGDTAKDLCSWRILRSLKDVEVLS